MIFMVRITPSTTAKELFDSFKACEIPCFSSVYEKGSLNSTPVSVETSLEATEELLPLMVLFPRALFKMRWKTSATSSAYFV
jgi:hypothetical protein